jgi:hypothetical protein
MSLRMPSLRFATLLVALLSTACGRSNHAAPITCQVDLECGPGAYCVEGACHAAVAPQATFTVPPSVAAARLVTLAGDASDADPRDSVTAWQWTVTALTAGCEAEPESTTDGALAVVFWCAGTYEVSLSATDSHGLTGAAHREVVTVAPAARQPLVTVGAAAAVGHRCAGTPLRCELETSVPLSAAGVDPRGGPVTYRWRAIPPSPDRAQASATITPGDGPSATAQIASDGTAISGGWRFRVRVEDADGNLGQAFQALEVGNRPPVVEAAASTLQHQYAGGVYRAAGPVAMAVTDPDGDPVSGELVLVEPAGSGCTGSLTAAGPGAGVVDLSCLQPASLGLERTLTLHAADVNGATADAQAPLQILNRPPVLVQAGPPASGILDVDHTVGPCPAGGGDCFLAAGTAHFVASDPDGDPLGDLAIAALWPESFTATAGEVGTGADPAFRFATRVSEPGQFRDTDGTTFFSVRATVADALGGSTQLVLPLRIGNRPPVLRLAAPEVSTGHRYDPAAGLYLASAGLMTFEDPDGDPLLPVGSRSGGPCNDFSVAGGQLQVGCRLAYPLSAGGLPPLASFLGRYTVNGQVSDGWELTAASSGLTISNQKPVGTPTSGALEACECLCPKTDADGNCLGTAHWRVAAAASAQFLPVSVLEADGDPIRATYTPLANGSVIAPQTVLAPNLGAPFTTGAFPVTYRIDLDDGTGPVSTTVDVTGLTCPQAGQVCTPN